MLYFKKLIIILAAFAAFAASSLAVYDRLNTNELLQRVRILDGAGRPRSDVVLIAGSNLLFPDKFGEVILPSEFSGVADVFCNSGKKKLLFRHVVPGTAHIMIDVECN